MGRNDGRILRFVGLKEGDATGCYSGTHVRRPIGIIHLSSDLSDKALRPNAKEAIRANDIRGSIEANLRPFKLKKPSSLTRQHVWGRAPEIRAVHPMRYATVRVILHLNLMDLLEAAINPARNP